MRISHKYKFIFLSKPRCASTAVRAILDPYSDVFSSHAPPFHHHVTAFELKTHFDKIGWQWKDYFIFTTVRNPWEMIVSYFTYFKPDVNGLYNFEKERDGFLYQPDKLASINDWIPNAKTYHRLSFFNGELIVNKWVDGFSKLTLSNTIHGVEGQSLVNRVLKVEELDNELYATLNDLGIKIAQRQDHINKTVHTHYRNYFNDQTKKMIEVQFISDINYGKYKF